MPIHDKKYPQNHDHVTKLLIQRNTFGLVRSRQSWIRLLRLNLPDYPCRVPSNTVEVGNVFSHNTSSPNSHAPPYSDTWKHYNITAEPAILADTDWLSEFRTFDAIAKERIKWMSTAVEGAVRANESTSSDGYDASVKEHGVEVDVDTFANPTRISIIEEGYGLCHVYLRLVP